MRQGSSYIAAHAVQVMPNFSSTCQLVETPTPSSTRKLFRGRRQTVRCDTGAHRWQPTNLRFAGKPRGLEADAHSVGPPCIVLRALMLVTIVYVLSGLLYVNAETLFLHDPRGRRSSRIKMGWHFRGCS